MLTQSTFKESINRADLEIKFNEGLQSAVNNSYTPLIEVVESASNSKMEVFFGDKPNLRRWHGEKKPQQFEEYKLNLTTDAWELTYTWKDADLRRESDPEKYIMREVTTFGQNFAKTKEDEFWTFLKLGTSIKGFDKANLFDFNHVYVNSQGVTNTLVAAQSNLHLGGSQLDATTLQVDQQHFAELKTDKNRPWGNPLSHIIVKRGSLNALKARELANSQFTVEASTVKGTMTENVFRGAFEIIETDSVQWGASEWAVAALGDANFKPVKVLSETRNPGFTNPLVLFLGLNENDNTSEGRFWRGDVASSVESYFDFNPGYWQTIKLHGSSSWTYTPADFESQRVINPNG